jgi:hypothetical protein
MFSATSSPETRRKRPAGSTRPTVWPPTTNSSLIAFGVSLICKPSVPLSVTPGMFTATVPRISPAIPFSAGVAPLLIRKLPLALVSESTVFVPSFSSNAAFATAMRTVLPPPTRCICSKLKSPLSVLPSTVSFDARAFHAHERPGGQRQIDFSPSTVNVSFTVAPVVFTATPNVPER